MAKVVEGLKFVIEDQAKIKPPADLPENGQGGPKKLTDEKQPKKLMPGKKKLLKKIGE